MSHRQQLRSLAAQVEVFKSQHAAMGVQIDALVRELQAAFMTAPPEEESKEGQPPKQRYLNEFQAGGESKQ